MLKNPKNKGNSPEKKLSLISRSRPAWLTHQAATTKTIALATSIIWVMAFAILPSSADSFDDPPQPEMQSGNLSIKGDWQDDQAARSEQKPSRHLIKGSVNYLVPKGTPFKLKLAMVPSHGAELKLLDRDLDGKLYPAKLGQEITARTSEDFFVDDNKVIPEGTVFHGTVSAIVPPKRVNRPGWLQISFDSLTTPDGRKFAFEAQADNYKPSTVKTKLKGLGGVASYTAGGAIVGALVAYELFGMHYTLAVHGYNIAGGAAGGALLATCYAIMRHGPQATLEPGDDLNMSIDCDLLMPAATDPTIKRAQTNRPGLDIKIGKTKVIKDGLEGNILRVEATIENQTDEPLKSIDLFLEDTNGMRHPLVGGADVDESSSFLFTIEPHSKEHRVLNFLVEYPKLKRQIVWLDHDTRQVCYRGSLP